MCILQQKMNIHQKLWIIVHILDLLRSNINRFMFTLVSYQERFNIYYYRIYFISRSFIHTYKLKEIFEYMQRKRKTLI